MAGLLESHRPHFGVAYFVRYAEVAQGDVVTFSYDAKPRYAFVLHPNYQDKMHALTLELTPRNILIQAVIDGMYDFANPQDLYESTIYKVAKSYDSYRTYNLDKIQKIRRLPYYITDKPNIGKVQFKPL